MDVPNLLFNSNARFFNQIQLEVETSNKAFSMPIRNAISLCIQLQTKQYIKKSQVKKFDFLVMSVFKNDSKCQILVSGQHSNLDDMMRKRYF